MSFKFEFPSDFEDSWKLHYSKKLAESHYGPNNDVKRAFCCSKGWAKVLTILFCQFGQSRTNIYFKNANIAIYCNISWLWHDLMSLKILDFLEKPWPNLAKKAQNINLKVKKPFWYIKVSFNNEETYQTMHLAKFGQENVAKTPNFQFQRYFYRHDGSFAYQKQSNAYNSFHHDLYNESIKDYEMIY